MEPYRSQVRWVLNPGYDANASWAHVTQNYLADFYLIAKRTLDEAEFLIFRFHFLGRADWKLCCRRLGIDRGIFFHAVYRIEQKLGRAYREVRPYSLFPCDEYFGGTIRKAKLMSSMEESVSKAIVRPPIRRAAA